MKKFSFTLQAVLDYRAYAEEQERIKLGKLLAEKQDLIATLSQVRTSLQETRLELQKRKEIFPYEIRLYRQYISSLESTLERLRRKEQQFDQQIDSQHDTLLSATQKRKVLDRLKFKRKEKYHRELERVRQKEIDELYLLARQNKPVS